MVFRSSLAGVLVLASPTAWANQLALPPRILLAQIETEGKL
jgi:hypothetical protein